MTRRIFTTLLMACFACGFFVPPTLAQVTFERLLNSSKEPQNWLTYSGDYAGRRFSSLDEINITNARSLTAKWVYQTGATGKLETTPLVVDGILYATAQDDRAFALDARTGRPIWMYQHQVPSDIRPCCGHVNRGLAILGDKVFLDTLDAHVIALDSKTGNVIWDVVAAEYQKGYSFTVAPLAVKGLVVIGVSGGEYGVRGFIDAYDAATGARKWRFYTVPGPGEAGHETWEGDSWKIGGAPAWNTGTYDAITNQIFWPTGDPAPSNRGEGRAGDNLYSNTLLALNADSGKMNWYFQFTKHDEHDWDANQMPVLVDRVRPLVLAANGAISNMRAQSIARCNPARPDIAAFVEACLVDFGSIDTIQPIIRVIQLQRIATGHNNFGRQARPGDCQQKCRYERAHVQSFLFPSTLTPKRSSRRSGSSVQLSKV